MTGGAVYSRRIFFTQKITRKRQVQQFKWQVFCTVRARPRALVWTRVDNSCILWLLKLTLALPTALLPRALRSKVAGGIWDGDMTLPLEVKAALPCPRIADRSGSMETDGDWLLAFLCCTNKNDNHNEMFQESTWISAIWMRFESGKRVSPFATR